MFGFLSPRPHSAEYRRHYARACVHLRRRYGLSALAFHSYEAVFAFQLAADGGAVPAGCVPSVRCCKLRRTGDPARDGDADAGHFAASLGVLLAGVKLDDDIADSRSTAARIARRVLAGPIRRAHAYFAAKDPAFPAEIRRILGSHAALEAAGKPVPADDYAGPTGEAFARVFGLLGTLPQCGRHAGTFAAVGRHLGRAILLFDCGTDFPRDRRRGEFNPLRNESEARAAVGTAVDELDRAAGLCRAAFGPDSAALATLQRVSRRLSRVPAAACRPPERGWAGILFSLAAAPFVARPAFRMSTGEPPGPDGLPPNGLPPGDGRRKELPQVDPAAADAATKSGSNCNSCDACTGCDCSICESSACDGCGNSCDGCGNSCDGCGGCDCNCN